MKRVSVKANQAPVKAARKDAYLRSRVSDTEARLESILIYLQDNSAAEYVTPEELHILSEAQDILVDILRSMDSV